MSGKYKGEMFEYSALTPFRLARALKLPLDQWFNNDNDIALAILERDLVNGEYRHGVFAVGVKRNHEGRTATTTKHSWIELQCGNIFDATRWYLETRDPYTYIGPSTGYSLDGQYTNSIGLVPPVSEGLYPTAKSVVDGLTSDVLAKVEELLGHSEDIDIHQIEWLMRINPELLGEFAQPLYMAVSTSGYSNLIPDFNYKHVFDCVRPTSGVK